jgi:F-type H+-transporting ATPase subunit delta
MLNLVDMLVATRRLGIMRAISGEYNRLLNEARGVEDAIVTTAKPASEADTEIIRQQLSKITGKKINILTATDPGLIAGLKARIGDKLIDGSISRRLVLLQNEISQGRI